MNAKETDKLLYLLEQISQSLAFLAQIQHQRLQVQIKMAITADSVNQILDILDTVLDRDANDVAAKEEAQAKWQALKDRDAGFEDPALQQKMDRVVAKAAASTPPDESGEPVNLNS